MGALWSSGSRTKRSSPNRPANMLPFTNAARLPNMGRMVTAGSTGTSFVKAALACSLGFGIAPPLIRPKESNGSPHLTALRQARLTYCKAGFTLRRDERAATKPGPHRSPDRAPVHPSGVAVCKDRDATAGRYAGGAGRPTVVGPLQDVDRRSARDGRLHDSACPIGRSDSRGTD